MAEYNHVPFSPAGSRRVRYRDGGELKPREHGEAEIMTNDELKSAAKECVPPPESVCDEPPRSEWEGPAYTEQQIHELSGRELWAAVHRLVLGDDLTANTDQRISDAVGGYVGAMGHRAGNAFMAQAVWTADEWKTGCPNPLGWTAWLWDHRHGQLYQSDLEQHVANWRAEPLEMGLDWCDTELLADGKVLQRCDLCRDSSEWWVDAGEGPICYGPDLRTAILRAACLVEIRKGE